MKKVMATTAMIVAAVMTHGAMAGVTAEQAAKLKSELTPLGAERAGNAAGTIPAWDGGYNGPVNIDGEGDIPQKIFADEKLLYQITPANMAEYDAVLSEGTKALLKKFPDTFRVDVYPTHRTAKAPQSIYDNTFLNATRCNSTENGLSTQGCAGGIPFPIPKDGFEAMWNHLLRVEANSEYVFKNIVGNADGSHTLATRNRMWSQFPQFYDDVTPENWSGNHWLMRFNTLEPPFKAGESLVFRDGNDAVTPRRAWQYLVGQRRVRRAPTVGYDTPDFVASGANYFDEVQGLMGGLDRFNWKLVGKKEMLIPNNNNGFFGTPITEAVATHHLNPDHVRWELHRVWEVEASVADGKRHAVPKRRYYLDEDTWAVALMDGYDSEGSLWRTTQMTPYVVPAAQGNLIKTATVFNLQANTMSIIQSLNEEVYKVRERKSESFFTGDAVAAEGIR